MTVNTIIRITPQDKECIRKAAKDEGMSTSTFIRRVLAQAGVFPIIQEQECES